MNTLLMTIMAIAALCGPRVQTSSATKNPEAKQCQQEMLKCALANNASIGNLDEQLKRCILEGK